MAETKCDRCEGTGKAIGSDRPFEWSGPGTYPGPCPKCHGTGLISTGMRTRAEMLTKLEQHKENLQLWESGYLAPTEPDADERATIMRELKAAIATLEWAMSDT